MKKVIFIDIDGTLVDYKGNLPESAVQAIRKARRNGHKIYLTTGRSEAEVYDYIWDIGVDGLIGGNGSYVKSGDNIILWKHLSEEENREIVNWLHSKNLEFYLEANSGLYASENFRKKSEKPLKRYIGSKGKNPEKFSVDDAFPDMIYNADLFRNDINKISFILNSYQDFLEAKENFPDLKVGTWGGVNEEALFGDIGILEIDKGEAINKILNYLGVNIKDTIAIGDAKVDIPMLEKCQVGVAMGNGSKEVKEIADFITDNVENDGLEKAFKKLELID